jgi:SPP1 gp7 family putative phage head morphogenesis protein
MSVNEQLQTRAIRHALLLSKYGAGLSDKLVRLLNSADEEILAKISARLAAIEERGIDTGPRTLKRLAQLREEIAALNSAIYGQVGKELFRELGKFADVEAGYQRDALRASLHADIEVVLPSAVKLAAIVTEAPMEGVVLSGWLDGLEAGRAARVNAAIRQGMVQGETTDQIVRRIRGTQAAKYTDGVLQISRRSATNVVRTATTHVSNVAAQSTWKANSNVVKGWQFLATLDGRTTITCSALSGQVFPIGEGPIPPRHTSCRSISVAVTKSFREMGLDADEFPAGTRASMDGQVAGDMKFSEWLTNKGEDTQDQILGPTRADMFRSGKLDLADFIKPDGTVLTLDQLKTKYPDILG